MIIGAHMSVAKGIDKAVESALSIGANSMQIFTRNPRGGKAKEYKDKEVSNFKELVKDNNFGPWVAHAPYTINLASNKAEVREFGVEFLKEDMWRMSNLGGNLMVVHTGSHTGQGDEIGLNLVIDNLKRVLENVPDGFYLLLEGMAGSGSEMGRNFEQLSYIISEVNSQNLAVCLDTAHLWGAGFDVRDWDSVYAKFNKTVGEDRLKAMHLNESIVELNSHKDRHGAINSGEIGAEYLKKIAKFLETKNIPIILETPNELEGYKKEIEFLRG